MEYPQELLPKVGYKRIISNESLSSFFLMRKTVAKEILDSSTQQIKDEYIEESGEEKRFLTWSCNLFNKFEIENLQFNVHNRDLTMKEWDFTTEVTPPIHLVDFSLETEFNQYFISISDINNNLRIPYKKGDNLEQIAKPLVYHSPNKSNFWHFEIRWLDAENNMISRNLSAWKNLMIGTMKAYIRNYCLMIEDIDKDKIESLSEEDYINILV
jgi:hypothetical protein